MTPLKNGEQSNKLNQTKKAVKEVIQKQSNDLVIVAGNDFNDKEMLNPLNYLDIFGISIDKKVPLEKILRRKDVLEAIEKLPLVSIVVGNNQDLEEVRELKRILDSKGIRKIFGTENPSEDLIKKIKYGMLLYSEENEEYKYNLGYDLYEELLKQ